MSTRQHQAPDRAHQQRKDALTKGNEIRTRRSHLKRDLKAERVQVLPLLVDPPEFIHTMKVIDLVLACPKHGRIKANNLLKRCEISLSATVGGLTVRQRRELRDELAGWQARRQPRGGR